MSFLKSQVGDWTLCWKTIPRGREGTAQVEVQAKNGSKSELELSWRRDGDGIWISIPQGTVGFDLKGEIDESGRMVYDVSQRNSHQDWIGVFATYGDGEVAVNSGVTKVKATRVRAQMPGKILRIMTQLGQTVQKDQPIVVMEAMKMENEIRAPQTGKVSQVKVVEGQAVETGADLILIDCSTE